MKSISVSFHKEDAVEAMKVDILEEEDFNRVTEGGTRHLFELDTNIGFSSFSMVKMPMEISITLPFNMKKKVKTHPTVSNLSLRISMNLWHCISMTLSSQMKNQRTKSKNMDLSITLPTCFTISWKTQNERRNMKDHNIVVSDC